MLVPTDGLKAPKAGFINFELFECMFPAYFAFPLPLLVPADLVPLSPMSR